VSPKRSRGPSQYEINVLVPAGQALKERGKTRGGLEITTECNVDWRTKVCSLCKADRRGSQKSESQTKDKGSEKKRKTVGGGGV